MDCKLGAYQRMDTLGKSQLDLILQVYDGAIKAYSDAWQCYRDKQFEGGYNNLEKAKRFVTHLYTTLDKEHGGEVAENLGRLYAHVINQTSVIEGTKDLKQIDALIQILNNVREGWAELKNQTDVGDPDAAADLSKINQHLVTTG